MFRNISVEDGLSNNFVTAIYQDSRGYMWFGTLDGLDRFDGTEIRSFSEKFPKQPVKVNRILEDPRQGIWIGSDAGLFYWDFYTERFEQIPFNGSPVITALLALPGDSLIMAGTTEGIWLVDVRSHQAEYLYLPQIVDKPLQVTDASMDENYIWVTTSGYLMKMGFSEFNVQVFVNEGDLPAFNNFSSVAVFNDTVIVGTQTRGLFMFDPVKNTFSPFADIGNKSILTVEYHAEGQLFVGTDGGGLVILNVNDHSYVAYQKEVLYPNSLNSNAIYSLYIDNHGRYWVGTYSGGVNYTTAHEGGFQVSLNENNLLLGQSSIRSLLIDDENNRYIGTRLGLYVSKPTGETYFFDKDNSILETNVILNLKKHKDDILIGTFRGGAGKFNHHINKIEPFHSNIISVSGSVYGFEHDQRGNLLIASMEGLYMEDAKTGVLKHYTSENSVLKDSRLISVLIDSNNRLWLGSISAGTSVYRLENNELVHLETELNLTQYKAVSLFEDSKRNVWIASEQGGLVKVSPGLDEKVVYTTNEGLSNNSVTAVTEAPENVFWITTLKGFCRLDFDSGKFRNYTLSNGLPSLVFNRGAIINRFKEEGVIWLGTESGLVSFKPDDIDKNNPGQRVTITDLLVSGKKVEPGTVNYLDSAVEQADRIVLRGTQTNLGFRFAALNFFNPSDNQYVYRLSGKEEEWQKSSGNYASFPKLKPGKYTFQVRLEGHNAEMTELTSIDLVVKPLWYQHIVFKLFLVFLITGIIYFVIRMILHLKQKVENNQLEKKGAKQSHKKYETSHLSIERSKEIEILLKAHVEGKKVYLNPELKLNDLAASIDCSPHDVSQVINQNLNQSFYEFINRYRIEAVKQCMTDPAFRKYTLLAMAQQCGYNSKTSFYRAFKKLTGQTPVEFQNVLNKKNSVA